MSFQFEKRESIIRYMLDKVDQDDNDFIKKTAENFQISVTSVKRYVEKCIDEKKIKKDSNTSCGLSLISDVYSFSYKCSEKLNEDIIYFNDIRPLLNNLQKNAVEIWSYAFMEIMNNAIEHSGTKTIKCTVCINALYTTMSINDNGIGIFRSIKQYFEKNNGVKISDMDALAELYKGKFTTNKLVHSGEGIFFSSKMVREFAIVSENTIFSTGGFDRDKLIHDYLISYYTNINDIGTSVVMKLENETKRTPKEVFEMYAPMDKGFIKTRIPIKDVCQYGEPIARSQARRIVYRLDQFEIVELDFQDVDFMGQGFADEVFRVFQNKYPDVEIIPVNANKDIIGMIKHVTE